MTLKEEELLRAKEVAVKFESELKEITLKHTTVQDDVCNADTHFLTFCCFYLLSQSFKSTWRYAFQ